MKRFLLISIITHAIVLAGFYFLPEPKQKNARDFFTHLVSPEEALKTEPAPTPIKKSPIVRPPRLMPVMPKLPNSSVPPAGIPQKSAPVPSAPLFPGLGKDNGKPLPDNTRGQGSDNPHEGKDRQEQSLGPAEQKSGGKPGGQRPLARNELFDPDIIGGAALKGQGGKKVNDAITFDTEDYRFAGYMRKLKQKIEGIWEYPPDAARKGLYGDLIIHFTIRKDGRLGAVELIRTSGYKMLDDAAIKALKDGEPYWPIPESWGMEAYTVKGHFFYAIYGKGVR